MNILLSSVGRRNYIVEYFKRVVDGKIIVSNSIENTSGMFSGDLAVLSPPIKSKQYIPFLIELCKRENIKLVVPLFDMDISTISYNKELFFENGIFPLVSDYNVVSKCFDKLSYNGLLKQLKLKTPKIFSNLQMTLHAIKMKELSFPLILKPRWGTGSISTTIVYSETGLIQKHGILSNDIKRKYIDIPVPEKFTNIIVIQEFIQGDEYGMDVINDLKGNFKTVWVKRKLEMRAGETDGAVTVSNKLLEQLGEKIGKFLKHIGLLDIDLILTEDNIPYIIDMNPRFGGGYPFSHQAGANLPKAIIKWLKNEKLTDELIIKKNVVSVKGIVLLTKNEKTSSFY